MNKKGFTTIELVVVILLIGVLSVTIIPKFINQDGFSEVTFQHRLIGLLRLQQTKAMQQTNQTCHRVLVTSDRFGMTFSGGNISCVSNTLPSDYDALNNGYEQGHYGISAHEVVNSSVTFSHHDIYFNALGCPVASEGAECINHDNADVEIIITGESILTVCIESQGYIHSGSCH